MTEEKRMTIEAPSIDAALEQASLELNVPIEKLRAVVLSETRGFLGLFGSKKLTVEVRTVIEEDKTDLMSRAIDFVNEMLRHMDIQANSILSEADKNTIDIQGDDADDYVVGRYGDCIRAMEYIVNLALRDPKIEPRVKIDSCGYRERRTKSLERLAVSTARQAVKFGRPVRLDPMVSWERWVIHNTLKNRDDVTTESVGEPPTRKVVVMPKFDPDRASGGVAGPATMRVRAMRERNERNNRNRNSNSRGRFRR